MILTRRRALAALGVVALARPAWAEAGPSMIVHKDPNCGCCTAWVEHVRSAGFVVEVRETTSMDAVKTRLRIPEALASCHTAEIGGYAIEGHVPATEILRLLAERPRAAGLAVPGMPVGSPGMEVPGSRPERYEIVQFGPAGNMIYARYSGAKRV